MTASLPCFAHTAAAALIVALTAMGCGGDGRSDHDLSGLVVAPSAPAPINVELAMTDATELERAIDTPHHLQAKRVGAHRFAGTSRAKVSLGDQTLTDLADETTIEFAAPDLLRAVLDNNHEYGREAIFVAGSLYLRPRFGKYHKRAPKPATEPAAIADQIYGTLAAYLEPLWARVAVTDGGRDNIEGRPVRIAKLSLSAAPVERPAASLEHTRWRNTVTVVAVEGTVALDADHGAVLSAKLDGTFQFMRGAKQLTMSVTVTHRWSDIGKSITVTAPKADMVVVAAHSTGEVDDAKALLKDLVADPDKVPAHKNNKRGKSKSKSKSKSVKTPPDNSKARDGIEKSTPDP